MFRRIPKLLVALAAVGGAAAGGAAVAGAATSHASAGSSGQASPARSAAYESAKDGTKDHGGSAREVRVERSDGSSAAIRLDRSFLEKAHPARPGALSSGRYDG